MNPSRVGATTPQETIDDDDGIWRIIAHNLYPRVDGGVMMGREPGRVSTHDPLALFLTWTTYGSWLPGDQRGWVDKPGRFREPESWRTYSARQQMADSELILDDQQRSMVEKTIVDHCRIRAWHLHAVNCRTQHVHVVVTAPNCDPEGVMNQFKSWCTRRLKEHARAKLQASSPLNPEAPAKELQPGNVRQKWWTQRGSKRQLYDKASLESAIRYVLDGQGD